MKLNKVVAIPALAFTAGISLAACGSAKAPAPAVKHTVTGPAAAPVVTKTTHSAKPAPVATTPAAAPKATVAQPAAQVPVLDVSTDGYSGIKPGEIGFSGDGGYVITGIIWSSWGPNGADGTGTSNIQGCVPDCATGSETPYTDTIVLSDPQGGQFTQVSSTRDGTLTAGPTSLIEGAAQNSPNAAPPVSTGTDPFTVVAEYFAAMGGQVNLPYAWSLLSSGEQTSMGSYSQWAAVRSDISAEYPTQISESGDQVTVSLQQNHYDGSSSNTTATFTVDDGVITAVS